VAALLARNPGAVVLVGVKATGPGRDAQQLALSRSFSIVEALRRFSFRDDAAETIGWTAVQKVPGAATGNVGFLVLGSESAGKKP
jgi:hypothetical protein